MFFRGAFFRGAVPLLLAVLFAVSARAESIPPADYTYKAAEPCLDDAVRASKPARPSDAVYRLCEDQMAVLLRALTALKGQKVLAFAGIGDPEKFFTTLRDAGIEVGAAIAFPDHHRYRRTEAASLIERASRGGLVPVTTEKDMARIRSDARLARYASEIATLDVTLEFDDEEKLRSLAIESLAEARNKTFKNQG